MHMLTYNYLKNFQHNFTNIVKLFVLSQYKYEWYFVLGVFIISKISTKILLTLLKTIRVRIEFKQAAKYLLHF